MLSRELTSDIEWAGIRVRKGTQVATLQAGGGDPVTFETLRDITLLPVKVTRAVSSHRTRNMARPRAIQTAAVEFVAVLVPRWPRVRRWTAREMPNSFWIKSPTARRVQSGAAMPNSSGLWVRSSRWMWTACSSERARPAPKGRPVRW